MWIPQIYVILPNVGGYLKGLSQILIVKVFYDSISRKFVFIVYQRHLLLPYPLVLSRIGIGKKCLSKKLNLKSSRT